MVHVVHFVTRINFGGLTTFLYNYYKNIDRDQIKFDIVAIDTNVKQSYHDKFEALGAQVYYMPEDLIQRTIFLIKLFRDNTYQVAHAHIEVQSAVYLLLAKFCNIPVRIAHAHWSRENKGVKNKILKYILNKVVSLRAGASELAIEAVFGEKYKYSGKVINNAVDLSLFKFSNAVREEYRKSFGLENKLVLGFVGRLTYQKNIPFLIEVFNKVVQKNPDSVLMIVGDGEDHELLNSTLENYKIKEKLLWLKEREDVNCLFSAMDILLLPSYYEGLPLVLVESQATSVHAVVSDTITSLVNLTPYIHFLPIQEEALDNWAKLISELGNEYVRDSTSDLLTKSRFNIKVEANNLLLLYKQLIQKSKE